MRATQKLSVLAVAVGIAACSATQSIPDAQVQGFTGSQPATLASHFQKLYIEGERNAVMNLSALAQAAIANREFGIAEKALDKAILRIETVYADNAAAEKARSLWNKEDNKDFKGEPYERAMVFFYRGLLYLRAGDYQNARAMFLSGDFQDTIAEKEEFQSDFGLMSWLAAWASECDGDSIRAKTLLARAVSANAARWRDRPVDKNWLLLVESGLGPVKSRAGKHNEKLLINEPETRLAAPRLGSANGVDAADSRLVLGADIVYQATTRGGRAFQEILNGKAEFKETSGDIGMASTMVANQTLANAQYTNNRDMANLGGAFALIGLVSTIASMSTEPEADARAWTQVPGAIHLAQGRLFAPGSTVTADVRFKDADGREQRATPAFSQAGSKCGITFAMARGSESYAAGKAEPADAEREEADEKFRAELERDFGGTVTRSAKL